MVIKSYIFLWEDINDIVLSKNRVIKYHEYYAIYVKLRMYMYVLEV